MARTLSQTPDAIACRARRGETKVGECMRFARQWKDAARRADARGDAADAASARRIVGNFVALARSFARSARYERRSAVHARLMDAYDRRRAERVV